MKEIYLKPEMFRTFTSIPRIVLCRGYVGDGYWMVPMKNVANAALFDTDAHITAYMGDECEIVKRDDSEMDALLEIPLEEELERSHIVAVHDDGEVSYILYLGQKGFLWLSGEILGFFGLNKGSGNCIFKGNTKKEIAKHEESGLLIRAGHNPDMWDLDKLVKLQRDKLGI